MTPRLPDATRRPGLPLAWIDALARLGALALLGALACLLTAAWPPPLHATSSGPSLLALDATGATLQHAQADLPRPAASLVKLLTALLTLDAAANGSLPLETPLPAPAAVAGATGARLGLVPGQTLPARDLLAAMLVGSANDAALTLAATIGGDAAGFVTAMHRKAAALGLTNSTFATPHGLPAPGQKTTARDMARLAMHLVRTHPAVLEITSQRELRVGDRRLENHNTLLARPLPTGRVDGLKSGHTREAGFCLASTALVNGTRRVAVVLGASSLAERDRLSWEMLSR